MMENKRLNVLVSLLISLIVIFAGCSQLKEPYAKSSSTTGTYKEQSFDPNAEISTLNFKSEAELNAFAQQYQPSYGSYGYYGAERFTLREGAVSKDVQSGAPSASAGGAIDFSRTNNQVESVDEGDIIKTDGEYIYTISSNTLYIIRAYPGEVSEIVSRLNIDGSPAGLFVNGNKLAVFGNYYNTAFFRKLGIRQYQGMTFFNIYDISDKTKPQLLKDYKFEGSYFQSRMKENWVYFVSVTYPWYNLKNPSPLIVEGESARHVPISNIYYFPIPYQSPQFATIHSIKLTDLTEPLNSKTVAVESTQNMYMSEDNIYITYTEYINEWQIERAVLRELAEPLLDSSDQQLIEKIKATDDDVLSQAEKQAKIMVLIDNYVSYLPEEDYSKLRSEINKEVDKRLEKYPFQQYTVINKIAISDGRIDVKANGKVPGSVINQFSLDEKDGILRVAVTAMPRQKIPRDIISLRDADGVKDAAAQTEAEKVAGDESVESKVTSTIIAPPIPESVNNVYTLDEQLNVLDSLTGLAEGEYIYSARFIGDRLYLVTFKQVDPFFVIELSNPREIKELGKLKIPGFSRYLHPYDDNTIIGIGREIEEGRQQGLKISLFDVSDVSNPQEIAKYVSPDKYAGSIAEWEHKAFLFSREKNLLAIPVYNYDYNNPQNSYNGVMVFKISKDAIILRGIVDHSKGLAYYYSPAVERSLYIEELLYTKSPSLLRINRIDDLSNVNSIELQPSIEGKVK